MTLSAHTWELLRAGPIQQPSGYRDLLPLYAAADQYCPEGRVGRSTGILCSTTYSELGMWATWRHDKWEDDFACFLLTYTGPTPFVYPAGVWGKTESCTDENFSVTDTKLFEKIIQRYWSSGVLLDEFIAHRCEIYAASNEWDCFGGEVLIDRKYITAHSSILCPIGS